MSSSLFFQQYSACSSDLDALRDRVCHLTAAVLLDVASRIYSKQHVLPSRLGLQNTPTASLQRGKTPPNECPGYDTKQSDGECGLPLHCHCSQVPSGSEW